jgi:hypothetical protein
MLGGLNSPESERGVLKLGREMGREVSSPGLRMSLARRGPASAYLASVYARRGRPFARG